MLQIKRVYKPVPIIFLTDLCPFLTGMGVQGKEEI